MNWGELGGSGRSLIEILFRRPHKESPTVHQTCRTDRGINKKGTTIGLRGRSAWAR
jgi:hypothetical protein